MPMSKEKNRERVRESSKERLEHENLEKQEHLKEIDETSAGIENLGLDESAESIGHISEEASKGREKKGAAFSGRKRKPIDPQDIRNRLLKVMPTEHKMKKTIQREIEAEIDYLHKKAMRMLRNPQKMNYFEMNNIMKKIRELKGILLTLAKASYESLKSLWLRFVHGIF